MMESVGGVYYDGDRIVIVNTFYINEYQFNRMLLTQQDNHKLLSEHMTSNQRNTKNPLFHIPFPVHIEHDIPRYKTTWEFINDVTKRNEFSHQMVELLLVIGENYTSHCGPQLLHDEHYSNTLI